MNYVGLVGYSMLSKSTSLQLVCFMYFLWDFEFFSYNGILKYQYIQNFDNVAFSITQHVFQP